MEAVRDHVAGVAVGAQEVLGGVLGQDLGPRLVREQLGRLLPPLVRVGDDHDRVEAQLVRDRLRDGLLLRARVEEEDGQVVALGADRRPVCQVAVVLLRQQEHRVHDQRGLDAEDVPRRVDRVLLAHGDRLELLQVPGVLGHERHGELVGAAVPERGAVRHPLVLRADEVQEEVVVDAPDQRVPQLVAADDEGAGDVVEAGERGEVLLLGVLVPDAPGEVHRHDVGGPVHPVAVVAERLVHHEDGAAEALDGAVQPVVGEDRAVVLAVPPSEDGDVVRLRRSAHACCPSLLSSVLFAWNVVRHSSTDVNDGIASR